MSISEYNDVTCPVCRLDAQPTESLPVVIAERQMLGKAESHWCRLSKPNYLAYIFLGRLPLD